jgi:SUMO ligase MMS21 Smc5/6 complex component
MNLLLSRINILNTTYENQLNNNMTPYQPFQDVLITTDDTDIKNLEINKLENNLNIDCSICISALIKDDEIIKTKCNHTFHKDCIIKYLKEYNNKCPICRTEVGKTKCHL